MEEKKNSTVEKLKKQCEEAKKNFESLNEELEKVIKEEEDRKKAQLAIDKEKRKQELDDAIEKAYKLLQLWFKDYGSYGYSNNTKTNLFDLLWSQIFSL